MVAGHEDGAGRIHRAQVMARHNPIATAIVDRAAALAGGGEGLAPAAAALQAAGCRYQSPRPTSCASEAGVQTAVEKP